MGCSNSAWWENSYELATTSRSTQVPPPLHSYKDSSSRMPHFQRRLIEALSPSPYTPPPDRSVLIPSSFDSIGSSVKATAENKTVSCAQQAPCIMSSGRQSLRTDFIGHSRTHSLSGSYAGSDQPSSCCTSPKLLSAQELFQPPDDDSDTASEVDCTLSLATPSTRKGAKCRVPTQASRCGSPAPAIADNDTSSGKFLWQPVSPDPPKPVNSSLTADFHSSELFGHRKAYKDSSAFSEAILNVFPLNICPKLSKPVSPWHPYYTATDNSSFQASMLQSPPGRAVKGFCNMPRSCAHCGTSKTPLWRNGPLGPKSLCNACGIRYKKVGRRICGYVRT